MNEMLEIGSMVRHAKAGVVNIGLFVALLLAGCTDKPENMAASPSPPDVVVAEVVQKTIPIVMGFAGTVKSVKAVDIVPRVSGYIEKQYFKEGTFLQDGDPLYLIDPRPFEARLKLHQAQLEEIRALLTYWKSESERRTRLFKQRAVSEADKEKGIAHPFEIRPRISDTSRRLSSNMT